LFFKDYFFKILSQVTSLSLCCIWKKSQISA
jgi:hypothetical protein